MAFMVNIIKQEDEFDNLKEKNSKLQNTINFFENLFDRLVKFSKDLYTHNIFSDKALNQFKMIIFEIKKMIKIKKKMIKR